MRLSARAAQFLETVGLPEASPAEAVGIVWSADDVRVDPLQAQPGDRVAVDVHIERQPGPGPDFLPALIRTVERFTRAPDDRGLVYDSAGAEVGRVLSVKGGLLRWRLNDAAAGSAAT